MVPPLASATRTPTTTYRVNLHTPRRPSPLNPASRKPLERQSREEQSENGQREGARRARTVSPVQKILRRRAAKTLQTNTLRKQVEAYEARTLQGLATKTSTTTKTPKGQDVPNGNIRIGISVTSSSSTQPSKKKKRRRRWGALWMFLRARPVVAALGSLWPFESKPAPELAWHPGEQPLAASAA